MSFKFWNVKKQQTQKKKEWGKKALSELCPIMFLRGRNNYQNPHMWLTRWPPGK